MRAILLKSLIAALLVGPSIGFVNYAASVRHAVKYEPPLSEAEMDRLSALSNKERDAALLGRTIELTRTQWIADSIGYSYFWKYVMENSIAPCVGVFVACLLVAGLERRRCSDPRSSAKIRG